LLAAEPHHPVYLMTPLLVSAVHIISVTVLHDIKVMSSGRMRYRSVCHLTMTSVTAAPHRINLSESVGSWTLFIVPNCKH
jgi:hypothetical protein